MNVTVPAATTARVELPLLLRDARALASAAMTVGGCRIACSTGAGVARPARIADEENVAAKGNEAGGAAGADGLRSRRAVCVSMLEVTQAHCRLRLDGEWVLALEASAGTHQLRVGSML